MKKLWKTICGRPAGYRFPAAVCLLLPLICFFTACGGDDREEPVSEADAYVYLSEEIPMPKGFYPDTFQSDGTFLYYLEAGKSKLCRIALGEKLSFDADSKTVLSCPYRTAFAGYTLDGEGSLYYFLQDTDFGKNYETVYRGGTLAKQTAEGDVVYELTLPDANTIMDSSPCMAVNGEGQAFLLAEDGIYVIDAGGTLQIKLPTDGCKPQGPDGRERLLEGEAGRVYYLTCTNFSIVTAIYEITGGSAPQLTRRDEILHDIDGIFPIFYNFGYDGGLLCGGDDGGLRQYGETEGAWHELLRFPESGLPKDISEIVRLSPDTILAHYYYFGASSAPATFLLTKAPASEVPQREALVLAVTSPWYTLDADVAAFNRANDRYYVEIELYEGEEGLMRLDSALVSDNPPDLLDLRDLSIYKYTDKQVPMDLLPYLESSSVLHREDFMENILGGYTIDGKLCCIPSTFLLQAMVGRTSQVGDAAGWTMADVMAMKERYPDSRLLGQSNFEYALDFCSDYILEHFVDWETGTCSFDNSEFTGLMNWIRLNTKNIYLNDEDEEDYITGAVPENMLLIRDWIHDPMAFGMVPLSWDEPVTLVGKPTEDRRPLYDIDVSDAICIVSGSDNPDGAWQFLEYLLSGKEYDPYSFSSRKDFLYQAIQEQTVPLYERDANGELIIHEYYTALENGKWVEHRNEPFLFSRGGLDINGVKMDYYYMEQEAADALREIVDTLDFTPQSDTRDEIMGIIMEEVAPCLSGDKSIDTAAGIIQNRVQTLIQEGL